MVTAKWEEVKNLKTAATQPWTRKRLFRCDPYLVWADAVTKPGVISEPNIAVLVELTAANDYQKFFKRMNSGRIDSGSFRFLPNGFEPNAMTRFITGIVNRGGLAILISDVVARRIERFSLQNSRDDIAQTVRAMWESYVSLAQILPTGKPQMFRATKVIKAGTYLGIVDDGLPVLRLKSFIQLAGKSAHFWDQGWQPLTAVGSQIKHGNPPNPSDPYWQIAWEFPFFVPIDAVHSVLKLPRGFLYGRRLKELSSWGTAKEPNDRNEYALTRYFSPAPRQSHGAATLGLLAPWISEAKKPVDWPDEISGLAMVQLPTRTVLDTSGGSLAMRVLDGLRYILWQEAKDRSDVNLTRPIVANVSYGVHAGPHDGSSMFERAVAEMLEANPHLHLVLPVGNAGRAGCHARRALLRRGEAGDTATITLQVLPDNGRDTFVEIWIPPGAKITLDIRPPGSPKTYKIREGEARIHFDPDPSDSDVPRRVHFGAIYSKEVSQGKYGGMALVAIGSTQRLLQPEILGLRGLNQHLRREVWGASGAWELTVQNLTSSPFEVDAWIERGDAPPDLRAGSRQAYFPDTCCESARTDNSTVDGTLNGIATFKHDRLHVVGAMRADGVLSAYSAAGRGRPPASRCGPDVVTTSDWSKNLPGVRTTGFVRGTVARINGTSAACAVYARALARKLAAESTKLPVANVPSDMPPEIDCVTDGQPVANPDLRGQGQRRAFPFGVDL